jgi:hypothetical protein
MKLAIVSVSLILASVGVASAHAPAYEGEKVILAEENEEEHSILHQVREFFGLENDYLPKEEVAEYGKYFLLYDISQSGVHQYNVSLISISNSEYESLYKAEYNINVKDSTAESTVYLSKNGRKILDSPRKLELPTDFEIKGNQTVGELVEKGHSHNGGGHEH